MNLFELIPEFLFNVELYGVVSCSNCFDIPFNKIVFGNLFDVVNVNDDEKCDRNKDAANAKT
jgi:hypothetical protein